jgi:hypothetical protein
MTLRKQKGKKNSGKKLVFMLYRVLCYTGHWPISSSIKIAAAKCAPPTLTSQGWLFHHDGITQNKSAIATLCVLCGVYARKWPSLPVYLYSLVCATEYKIAQYKDRIKLLFLLEWGWKAGRGEGLSYLMWIFKNVWQLGTILQQGSLLNFMISFNQEMKTGNSVSLP